MITPGSTADGRISSIVKIASGVASLSVTGPFQGDFDLLYTIEIDSTSSGSEIGSATFRWKTSNTTAGSWEQSGVTTSTSPTALSADGLGTNISIRWTGATGIDCVVGDTRQFSTKALYGRERLLDGNRMTVWRATGDTSERIVIDFGSPQNITSFVMQDHNFTSGASVKLQANASDSWGSPSYDSGDLTIQDPIYTYPDQTYRYWSPVIADPSNPDGYVEVASMFLGVYKTFDNVNAWWGSSQADGYILQANRSESGVLRRYAYGRQRKLSLDFGNTVSNDDIDKFLAIQNSLVNTDTNSVKPFWLHLFSDEADTLRLMEWENLQEWSHQYFQFLKNSGVILETSEVVKV